jgi:hypothetical protein
VITVAILINGQPIVAKNAINQALENDKGEIAYKTDSGEIIWHQRSAGAVALAHKLLDGIKNDEKGSGGE